MNYRKGNWYIYRKEGVFGEDGEKEEGELSFDTKSIMKRAEGAKEEEGGDEQKTDGEPKEEKSQDETNESEKDSEEKEGEEKEDSTDDGIKTIDDALDMHKKDQQYITELQQKNKELTETLAPLVKETDEGKMVIDGDKLQQLMQKNQKPEITDDQRKQATNNFWEQFDKDPISTLYKIVSDAQRVVMRPYEEDIMTRKQKSEVEQMHEEKYNKYGDLRKDVSEILNKDNSLSVEDAYNKAVVNVLPELLKNTKEEKKESKPNAATGDSSEKIKPSNKTQEEQIRDSILQEKESDSIFAL